MKIFFLNKNARVAQLVERPDKDREGREKFVEMFYTYIIQSQKLVDIILVIHQVLKKGYFITTVVR